MRVYLQKIKYQGWVVSFKIQNGSSVFEYIERFNFKFFAQRYAKKISKLNPSNLIAPYIECYKDGKKLV